jgi:hypothetical protein
MGSSRQLSDGRTRICCHAVGACEEKGLGQIAKRKSGRTSKAVVAASQTAQPTRQARSFPSPSDCRLPVGSLPHCGRQIASQVGDSAISKAIKPSLFAPAGRRRSAGRVVARCEAQLVPRLQGRSSSPTDAPGLRWRGVTSVINDKREGRLSGRPFCFERRNDAALPSRRV